MARWPGGTVGGKVPRFNPANVAHVERRRKDAPIALTTDDWIEIAAALDSKIAGIKCGAYGPEDKPGDDKRWIAHLRAIQRKIGPDGSHAHRRCTQGV